ncbi:MAG: GNAT family N-acetyltransferase, partial [Nitrososphaerales archaeon]
MNIEKFQNMLLNERSFDRLFCDVSNSNRFDLYYNQRFSDDPVFNHAVIDDAILESIDELDEESLHVLLYEVKSEAIRRNVPPTIFVERFWKISQRLEKVAIEDGYVIGGLMDILSKEVNADSDDLSKDQNDVIETRDVGLWNEIFMHSYSINPAWESELIRRERLFSNDRNTVLFLAREKNETAGCMLLHKLPDDLVGIYCLGTLPERRNRGIAKSLIRTAEGYASRIGSKHLTLQTVARDGVTPMYEKMGF